MPTIRTTMRPDEEIVVSDAEYERLLEIGVIYDGTPPVEPADAFDLRMAARIVDTDSSARDALDALYGGGGGGGWTAVDASETVKGIVELATTTETTTGTDTVRAVTPAGVKAVGDTKAALTHTHTASQVSDSTTVGRSVLTAADAAAARTAIGAGTSSLALGTTGSTAKAGDYAPPAASETASGIVELATAAEATAQADGTRAVTPLGLADRLKGAGGLTTAYRLTQAAYDALGTKDANTLYVIVG